MDDLKRLLLEEIGKVLPSSDEMKAAIPRCVYVSITVTQQSPLALELAKHVSLFECTCDGKDPGRGVFSVILDCTTGTEFSPSCPDLQHSCYAFMVDMCEKRTEAEFLEELAAKLKAGIAALAELNSEPTPIVVGA